MPAEITGFAAGRSRFPPADQCERGQAIKLTLAESYHSLGYGFRRPARREKGGIGKPERGGGK
jgi:hypothetical protein